MSLVVLTLVMSLLSVVSGMLGIGVAFAAVPLLSLALPDLVNQVHPLSLALNGATALFAMIGFAWAGLVDWQRGWMLAGVTTLVAPIGAMLARWAPEMLIWMAYVVAAAYFIWSMFHPVARQPWHTRFGAVLAWAVPIAILTGFIGVGPGFLLVPAMMRHGIDIKRAAGLNALAATPASFAAMIPHWEHMAISAELAIPLLASGALGAVVGARLASNRLSGMALRRILAVSIICMLGYRMLRLVV